MKFLVFLFALIAVAFAAPQFFPGFGGGFGASGSSAQASTYLNNLIWFKMTNNWFS